MTLASRLTATYAAVILVALLIFAAVAVLAIDRAMRVTMDSRLITEARSAASLADISHGRLVADEEDRRQFLSLIAAGDDGLAMDRDGDVRMSTAANPPAQILTLPRDTQQYYSLGSGDARTRAAVLPVPHKGKIAGTVIVWGASSWIAQTDRSAAIAFALAAVIIALFALLAGGAVTRRALEDAFERQRRFTADASHELRTPLAVIRAEADLALSKERNVADYRTAMNTIAGEADRMELLIGDLLATARAESGAATPERIDVRALLDDVAERLASAARAKSAHIAVRDGDRATIVADRNAIERALLAIAHNAVAHAPPGGVIDLCVSRHSNAVEVTVRDNGAGFTAEGLEHALDRFWRSDSGRSHGGTGLGLAIANAIVTSAGGSIALENAPEGGALVHLRFPAA